MNAGILVIGAGPAGLSAAIAASSTGADVRLVDEHDEPGGQLAYRLTDEARALRTRLLAELASSGARVQPRSVVWSVFVSGETSISASGVSSRIGFDRLILATGSTDRVASFPGGSLPGVFTERAAQILMHRHWVLPGRRCAVVGDDGDEIAGDLVRCGGEVVARVVGSRLDRMAASGEAGVERLDVDGTRHDVDAIILALGKAPDPRLAVMAECAVVHDPALGGFVPARTETMRTSDERIYVAGEMAGARGLQVDVAEGRLAGLAAAASLGFGTATAVDRAQTEYEAIASAPDWAATSSKYVQFAGQEQWL